MSLLREYSTFEIDEIYKAKDRLEKTFKEKWDSLKLDAVIGPVYPHSAFKHEDAEELAFIADFLTIWNVLDYPAGVVPVTTVQEGEDVPEAFSDNYNDVITSKLKNSIRGSIGMPIGV